MWSSRHADEHLFGTGQSVKSCDSIKKGSLSELPISGPADAVDASRTKHAALAATSRPATKETLHGNSCRSELALQRLL
ncbi:hypothetical protein FAZ69_16105 [Trinickia terrae]|uniref:Uncharacterized protein n=1 Tax=Trinickia terrae TaxID=2571161 RepID=A0A4V5PIK8_9BURK|nr:hypothetical protein [Trinickia terrae]TKC87800.1 hypothetical protein FAZ69_16105 [Trinickia terrae]